MSSTVLACYGDKLEDRELLRRFALPEIFADLSSSVRELRDVIVDTLNRNPALCDNEEIAEAVRSNNGLLWELFRKSKGLSATIIKNQETEDETDVCHRCGRVWENESVHLCKH